MPTFQYVLYSFFLIFKIFKQTAALAVAAAILDSQTRLVGEPR